MRIYTRAGDDGSTGLIGGPRVSKSSIRVESYGTVDELNAWLGWAALHVSPAMRLRIERVQNELFVVGSHLAMAPGRMASVELPPLDAAMAGRLEHEIDEAEASIPPLAQFILPGGCEAAARLHVARTVCRRAERLVVALEESGPASPGVVAYLNRLSDWLFVMARLANHEAGRGDVPWNKRFAQDQPKP